MNTTTENCDGSKVCHLDISFDLDDFDIKSKNQKCSSPDGCIGKNSEIHQNFAQIERNNENLHEYDNSKVDLNISFDYIDLEPISFENRKELFAFDSPLPRGIFNKINKK